MVEAVSEPVALNAELLSVYEYEIKRIDKEEEINNAVFPADT